MGSTTASARWEHRPDDGGFILLESMLSISLIVVMVAALTTFFVSASTGATQQKNKQAATVIAGNAIDQVHALVPSDTYAGHSSTAVATQISTAPVQVTPWLANMYPAYDDSGAAAKLPMTLPSQTRNGIVYTTNVYIGSCGLPLSSTDGTQCLTTCPDSSHQAMGSCTPGYAAAVQLAAFLRVVVAVTWSDTHCPNSTCAYLTATLISTDSDPNFLLNQSPPSPPVMTTMSAQTAAINDAVSVQASLIANSGVNPITWTSSTLPPGLSIAVDTGLISGSPTGVTTASSTGTASVTVTATDAFGRTDSKTFNWTILPDLIPSSPAPQSAITTKAISTVTMSATGGTGSGYVWSVPASGQPGSLPPGIVISAGGAISGTPTTSGTYTSQVSVADSSGRTRTRAVTFTVYAAPTVSGLNATNLMPGWTPAVALAYTCSTGGCRYAVSGAPSGIGLSLTSNGSPTTYVDVTSTSGTIYLTGTVPGGTTTAGQSWSVAVTPTETAKFNYAAAPATATWTAGVRAASGARSTAFTTQAVNYTCATTTCTAAISIKTGTTTTQPAWLSTSASLTPALSSVVVNAGSGVFYVGGSLPATAGTYTVTLKLTDLTGAAIGTTTATWTVT